MINGFLGESILKCNGDILHPLRNQFRQNANSITMRQTFGPRCNQYKEIFPDAVLLLWFIIWLVFVCSNIQLFANYLIYKEEIAIYHAWNNNVNILKNIKIFMSTKTIYLFPASIKKLIASQKRHLTMGTLREFKFEKTQLPS